MLAWLNFVYPWLHVSLLVSPYSLWNHAQLGGGSVVECLMSTLAYGWVERCSDVVGCDTNLFHDKYPYLFYLYICICDYDLI